LEVQHKTLTTYLDNDQRRILKFVHDWLPTGKRLFREGLEASLGCLLCGYLEETSDHILICQRDIQEQTRLKIVEYRQKDMANNHGHSKLNNILEIALMETPRNRDWMPLI
jgi:hypothetical protein